MIWNDGISATSLNLYEQVKRRQHYFTAILFNFFESNWRATLSNSEAAFANESDYPLTVTIVLLLQFTMDNVFQFCFNCL